MTRSGGRLAGRLRAAATQRRLTLAGTVLVVAGLLFALRDVDVASVLATIARADPWLLAAAAGLYALSWPVRGARYGDVLSTTGHPLGTTFLTGSIFLSQTANLVVPARAGDAVRAHVLNARRTVPYPAGFASLAVERGFDLAAVAALAGAAILSLVLVGGAGPLALLADTPGGRTALLAAGGVTAATLALGVLTVGLAHARRRPAAVGSWLGERVPRLRGPLVALAGFARDVAVVARTPRAMARVGAASLLIWLLDVATAILVLAAIGSGLTPGSLLVVGTLAVSVGNLAKVLPLSQGGIGLYEAGFTAIVVALTPVGAGVALAAAVVDHALKNGVTLLGGSVAIARFGISPAGAARDASEEHAGGSSAETDNLLG